MQDFSIKPLIPVIDSWKNLLFRRGDTERLAARDDAVCTPCEHRRDRLRALRLPAGR